MIKIHFFYLRAFAAWEEKTPVDKDAEEQYLVTLTEYKKKLIIDGVILPDPTTIKKSNWIGESDNDMLNWPPIYYSDIAKFLEQINTPKELLHRLDCEYKEGKGYRYYACEFVKEIFWTGISDNSKYCIIKCKVTPSQRTSSTPYNTWVIVQKEKPGGKILSAYCSCTAGLLGCCNHVVGTLFRVEAAVLTGVTKPTCTSKSCQWNIPSNNKKILEIKPIAELSFIKHHYRKKTDKDKADKERQLFNAFSPSYESLNFLILIKCGKRSLI